MSTIYSRSGETKVKTEKELCFSHDQPLTNSEKPDEGKNYRLNLA